MPGGWTVTDRTSGRRLRCRYAAVTDVSTGPVPEPESVARHCRYRAFGLTIGDPSAAVCAGDQSLHVSSGVSVLPERVKSSTRLPEGVDPRQLMAPHVDAICASRTSD